MMKKLLLILTALFITFMGYSQTFILNNITYSVTSTSPNTVAVINYNINGGSDVVIPETVTPGVSGKSSSTKATNTAMVTYNVTTIAANAFNGKSLTSVEIPNSVLTIGSQAFSLNFMTSAMIGNSVTSIGFNAFFNNNLSSITIPNSVATIGVRAFDDNLLTSVTIPSNVTTIGFAAFRGNPLTSVISESTLPPTITTGGTGDTFNSDRSNIDLVIPNGTEGAYVTDVNALWTGFKTVNGLGAAAVGDTFVEDFITYEITSISSNKVKITDYDTAGGTTVNIPTVTVNNYNVTEIAPDAFRDNSLTDVTIPVGVTSIGQNAFRGNSLTTVVIPNGVTFIATNTFFGNNLTSVTIPNSVTTIWINSFYGNNLTNVTLPAGLTAIGTGAFRDNSLSSIVIPNGVTTIGSGAFNGNNLTSVVIPDGVSSILGFTFRNNNLTSVTLPAGLTSIGSVAFDGNNLTSITLPVGLTSIESSAFSNNDLTSITIPSDVTNIGENAFLSNQLTSITIPSNVTNIGSYAFFNNPLTNVTSFATTTPSIITDGINGSSDTFSSDRSSIDLIIPNGTVGSYVTDAGALWTGFKTVNGVVLSVSNFELTNDLKLITTAKEIQLIFSNNLQLKNYSLYNISGVEVAKGKEKEIGISSFAQGIYILKLDFDKGTFTKKIAIN